MLHLESKDSLVIIARPQLFVDVLLEIARQYNAELVTEKSEPKQVSEKKLAQGATGKELVELGYNYQQGNGVQVNLKRAYECYEKAVQMNYILAYFYLAYMYKKGWSVSQNNETACEYLVKGAKLSNMRAMEELIEGTA